MGGVVIMLYRYMAGHSMRVEHNSSHDNVDLGDHGQGCSTHPADKTTVLYLTHVEFFAFRAHALQEPLLRLRSRSDADILHEKYMPV